MQPNKREGNSSSRFETMSNTSAANDHLADLLATFNATFLGEGDINCGTNLLVSMATTLANVSRPGSGIWASKSFLLRAGSNLLVSGGLTSSLVADRIFREVAARQNNLIAQAHRLMNDKIEDANKTGLRMTRFPEGPGRNASQRAMRETEGEESLVCLDPLNTWEDVMRCPPNPKIDELAQKAKALVTAANPKDLDRQLAGLHINRPLIALTLRQPADVPALEETCGGMIDGVLPSGEYGEMILGNLLITDPTNLLAKVVPGSGEEPGWVERMVWLVDGNYGPEAREANLPETGVRTGSMVMRFERALLRALAKRFNNQDTSEEVHEFDLGPHQLSWAEYLRTMEGRLPGISGTARGFLGTLTYGLIELARAPGYQGLKFSPEGVEALGRWVIERMANARVEMTHSAELERRFEIARKIFFKVLGGPLNDRDIYRALSIRAELCRELLRVMEEVGVLQQDAKRWECVEGAVFSDSIRDRLALAA